MTADCVAACVRALLGEEALDEDPSSGEPSSSVGGSGGGEGGPGGGDDGVLVLEPKPSPFPLPMTGKMLKEVAQVSR